MKIYNVINVNELKFLLINSDFQVGVKRKFIFLLIDINKIKLYFKG